MKLEAHPYDLKFRHPFRLAGTTRDHTPAVMVEIHDEGHTGYGEAALPPYREETQQSVMRFCKNADLTGLLLHHDLTASIDHLYDMGPGDFGAKAALDMALHDLYCKKRGISLSVYFHLQSAKFPATSYTLGISSEAELLQKLEEAASFSLIKLKLGSSDDKQYLNTFLKHCSKPFFADANQGWSNYHHAHYMSTMLREAGALFIEQPMPVQQHVDMVRLANSHSDVVFVADESFQTMADAPQIAQCFKGINVKLMKCGGLAAALEIIEYARSTGLLTVIGCMSESSCAVTAAAHLAPFADYADLDGPLLITNDPFTGVTYREGRIHIPTGHGLGVRKRTGYANP